MSRYMPHISVFDVWRARYMACVEGGLPPPKTQPSVMLVDKFQFMNIYRVIQQSSDTCSTSRSILLYYQLGCSRLRCCVGVGASGQRNRYSPDDVKPLSGKDRLGLAARHRSREGRCDSSCCRREAADGLSSSERASRAVAAAAEGVSASSAWLTASRLPSQKSGRSPCLRARASR